MEGYCCFRLLLLPSEFTSFLGFAFGFVMILSCMIWSHRLFWFVSVLVDESFVFLISPWIHFNKCVSFEFRFCLWPQTYIPSKNWVCPDEHYACTDLGFDYCNIGHGAERSSGSGCTRTLCTYGSWRAATADWDGPAADSSWSGSWRVCCWWWRNDEASSRERGEGRRVEYRTKQEKGNRGSLWKHLDMNSRLLLASCPSSGEWFLDCCRENKWIARLLSFQRKVKLGEEMS